MRSVRSALACLLLLLTALPALAQIDPAVRDKVVPAAVQIAMAVNVTSTAGIETRTVPMGSGTVVAANGLILTNWHVVDMAAFRQELQDLQVQMTTQGQPVTFELNEQSVLILTSDGVTAPQPRYVAVLAAQDPALDLAVLRVTSTTDGQTDPATLNLPFVPLGDSDAVGLGDPVDIFGYPGIADGPLTSAPGVVSGFTAEGELGRAWILTDATISGGSSGGTAVNRAGALIGVPTSGSPIDCQPGDVNQDGKVDAQDVGCIPTGGSLGQLRPINLAKPLLAQAAQSAIPTPTLAVPTPTLAVPTPTLPAIPPTLAVPTPTQQVPAAALVPQQPLPPGTSTLPLPDSLPLSHADCFEMVRDSPLAFETMVTRLGATAEARTKLQEWKWLASANRVFRCASPPEGESFLIDMSLHLFADAANMPAATDYFAAVRANGLSLVTTSPPAMGDYATAITGATEFGTEYTLFTTKGPLLIRVTGVATSGIPFINVFSVAEALLAMPVPSPVPVAPALVPQQPGQGGAGSGAMAALPTALTLAHASCFSVADEGTLDFAALVDRFEGVPDAEARLQALGWRDSAYRQFDCATPPAGSTRMIDVAINQFQDAASAAAAVPFFANARALGTSLQTATAPSLGEAAAALSGATPDGTEYTLYVSRGPTLYRVTGISVSGNPAAEVEQVMTQLTAAATVPGQTTIVPTATPIGAAPTPLPTPTIIRAPTVAPTPQTMPPPTQQTLPPPSLQTAPPPAPNTTTTVLPPPTVAVVLPTAVPQPTSTPRVIQPPVSIAPPP